MFSVSVFAQVQNTDISIDISPAFPTANENVTVRLNTYVIDLSRANITWLINDQEVATGIGKKVFSFTMGGIGESTTVTARIDTVDGQSLVKSITVIGTNVDMLWEAVDSYAPPFYKGKTLVAREGTFKVVALPSIQSKTGYINPNNLSYTWERDNKGAPNASGWGKSAFSFKQSYLDKVSTVEVKVGDIFGSVNTSGKILLQGTQPKILFYEKDPLLGMQMQRSLNSSGFQVAKEGSTLVAVPYFFSPKDLNSANLKWEWFTGGTPISTPTVKNELSVKGVEGKSGTSRIKLIINNTKTLFQTAEKEINANF
ncbi:MAG: hypothetical protein UU24_C0003G0021 [Candidatus Nomurabacteria bacterium GW2011_GWA2_40_9]|uniref:Uncharacterized protein n=1 Tax=Candidatus Nomurabacteria bacterium GW2011_GWA2_40_9 TaxID=1618734 RepID=A0A0G0TY60_9BACT|nr:MAG: hypothetical protein UU24_C0003G0021 [Candidatus Nomurabacteria bacterium GW2011_GWA2_40_9]